MGGVIGGQIGGVMSATIDYNSILAIRRIGEVRVCWEIKL
jgi:hypothetical protein